MILPPAHILDFVPDYRTTQTPWQGLAPLAAWLVEDLGPGRIVELGSYRGDSFFAFLEAAAGDARVKDLVAIDSWQGDRHTGPFPDAVHRQFARELERRADPRARFIRSLFADAVTRFDDASIDLLHIDGAHDYASVAADYRAWLPKMAADGVVLFHDTMVRADDFGVWRLWREIERDHPGRTFNFEHANGLGILCLGSDRSGRIRGLCTLDRVSSGIVREALRIAGERVRILTDYEYGLVLQCGGAVRDDHVFARGEARLAIEAMRRVAALNGAGLASLADLAALRADLEDRQDRKTETVLAEALGQAEASLERLFRDRPGDVFAALRPMLDEVLSSLRAEMNDRQDRKTETVLAAALGQAEASLERLFRDRPGDVFAALRPMLDEVLSSLRAEMNDRQDRKTEAALAEASGRVAALVPETVRRVARIKDEAQDDAIIGIGAKVDAHEQAIQELASYLREVLQHPIFRK